MPEPVVATNIVFFQPIDSGKVAPFDKPGCDGTAAKCCPNDTEWEIYTPANGRVIIGIGNAAEPGSTFHAFGTTGGEEKHKLTTDELPKHNHNYTIYGPDGPGGNDGGDELDVDKSSIVNTSSVGGDEPHNNMMPYKTLTYCKKK
jgi:hypothetical protein